MREDITITARPRAFAWSGVLALALLAGCGEREAASEAAANYDRDAASGNAVIPAVEPSDEVAPRDARWELISSGEGSGLHFGPGGERGIIEIFCPAVAGEIVVNVPAFMPIASEERMSMGQGGVVATLVADPAGDPHRGGVTGAAPVPADLAALLAGAPSVSYGAQASGPHPAPPADLVEDFVTACNDRAPRGD